MERSHQAKLNFFFVKSKEMNAAEEGQGHPEGLPYASILKGYFVYTYSLESIADDFVPLGSFRPYPTRPS